MCLAIFISGNHAYFMRDILIKRQITAEIVSAPANLTEGVCSTALQLSKKDISLLQKLAAEHKCPIYAMYHQVRNGNGFIYRKI